MLEVSLIGLGTVLGTILRLGKDAWSMVKSLTQPTNKYAPPPNARSTHHPSVCLQGAVTDGNKAEYVSAKARFILVGSRKPALEALKEGFARALRDLSPGAAPFMGLLSHADWRVLLCGQEHVSGPQVYAVHVYGCVFLWRVFRVFEERHNISRWILFLFLCGGSGAGAGGGDGSGP